MKKLLTTCLLALLVAACDPSKVGDWQAEKSNVLPQLVVNTDVNRDVFMAQQFSWGADMVYVVTRGKKYYMVPRETFNTWGISEEELFEQAVKNLEKISRDVPVEIGIAPGLQKYIVIETGDGFAAARVFSEELRKKVVGELGGPAIAGIPTRDVAIFWPKDFNLHQEFLEQVQTEFFADKEYPLTGELFLITEDSIERYLDE